MKKQNILVIINPVAGRKRAKSILYKIVDSLSQSGHKTTIFTTTQKGEAVYIVKEHATEAKKIICCGGDGTFNEVITGLATMASQIPIGYIPTGTTNDLAGALKLPVKTHKAIDTAINGKVRQHDIGLLNEKHYFSYVASFGAFTRASYSTPQWLKNMIGRMFSKEY